MLNNLVGQAERRVRVLILILVFLVTGCASGTHVGGKLSGGTVDTKTWNQQVKKILPSVVKIKVLGCDFSGSGSGFFTSGWIVTNRHVLEGARSVSFQSEAGKFQVSNWFLSSTDDIGLISISKLKSRPIELGEGNPTPGDLVAAAGFPWGGPEVTKFGRITGEDLEGRDSSKTFLIQTNLDIHPGNSGGPLLDSSGRVIGVMVAIDTSTNASLAIPLSRLIANLGSENKDFIHGEKC